MPETMAAGEKVSTKIYTPQADTWRGAVRRRCVAAFRKYAQIKDKMAQKLRMNAVLSRQCQFALTFLSLWMTVGPSF
jgi:hypothetical protein